MNKNLCETCGERVAVIALYTPHGSKPRISICAECLQSCQDLNEVERVSSFAYRMRETAVQS